MTIHTVYIKHEIERIFKNNEYILPEYDTPENEISVITLDVEGSIKYTAGQNNYLWAESYPEEFDIDIVKLTDHHGKSWSLKDLDQDEIDNIIEDLDNKHFDA